MLNGIYAEPNTSVPANNFFNESLEYDVNGNITKLYRNAKNSNGLAEQIDKLGYVYAGNQLITVNDTSTNYRGYPDVSGNTITYDDNGNMTNQKDKGILEIGYNFLNLANYIKFDKQYFTRGRWLNVSTNYTYRADGTKLRRVYKYTEDSLFKQKTTEYLDGFQYEVISTNTDPEIKFAATSEGYFNFENNKYIYNYMDHLGNVRVSYFNNGSGAEVLEENNYYPFGLKHEGYNVLTGNPANQYKYNEKEVQTETGWSDYGWRQYMPEIGRWNGIDQLAEKYLSTSTYAYVANNPISNSDVDGRWFNQEGGIDTSGYSSGFVRPTKAFTTQFLGQFSGEGGGTTVGELLDALAGKSNANGIDFSQFDFTKYGADDDGGPGKPFIFMIGGADLALGFMGKSDTTLSIENRLKKNGMTVSSDNHDYFGSTTDVTQGFANYVAAQYSILKKDVILYGYSRGGVEVMKVARLLEKQNVPIKMMVLVDAANGPNSGSVNRKIPGNVQNVINYYQTHSTLPLFSHGDKAIGTNPNTRIINYNVSNNYINNKIRVNHSNIDEAFMNAVITNILNYK